MWHITILYAILIRELDKILYYYEIYNNEVCRPTRCVCAWGCTLKILINTNTNTNTFHHSWSELLVSMFYALLHDYWQDIFAVFLFQLLCQIHEAVGWCYRKYGGWTYQYNAYINGMSTGHLVETPYRFSNLSTSSIISVSITLMDRSIFFKYYISNLSVPLQLLVALWIDV